MRTEYGQAGEIDVRAYDMVEADPSKVLEELGFADGILLGSPTILGEALKPIWDLTTSIFAGTHGQKLASAFGSYGWSGEAVPHLLERLRQLNMKVEEGFKVRLKPDENNLQDAFDYGFNFGCMLQEKENPKKKQGSRTLVKCLVCGAIFDSSIDICPVCGVGREQFVEVEVEETEFSNDTKNFYVILGNGAAGHSAAKAVRERDRTGTIVMISNEPYRTYNRPMLTKSIMADLSEEQIAVEDASWYEEQKIYQILGREVVGIDPETREVHLDNGEKYHYTKLIYALGSECFIPPIKGVDLDGVVAVRRLADTRKVAEKLKETKHVVVIGGGVSGTGGRMGVEKSKMRGNGSGAGSGADGPSARPGSGGDAAKNQRRPGDTDSHRCPDRSHRRGRQCQWSSSCRRYSLSGGACDSFLWCAGKHCHCKGSGYRDRSRGHRQREDGDKPAGYLRMR